MEQADGIERIMADPRYAALVRERARFARRLSVLIVGAYAGYLLLVAFGRSLLATPIGGGVTTIGIPVGIGLILFAILLTALYVHRANGSFDRRMAEILADAGL